MRITGTFLDEIGHDIPAQNWGRAEFLSINKALADKHGIECWTNSESFDRDVPIKVLPVKREKLLLKLEATEQAGYNQAVTFEFSHFLSPHSCYPQAHGLYQRYLL